MPEKEALLEEYKIQMQRHIKDHIDQKLKELLSYTAQEAAKLSDAYYLRLDEYAFKDTLNMRIKNISGNFIETYEAYVTNHIRKLSNAEEFEIEVSQIEKIRLEFPLLMRETFSKQLDNAFLLFQEDIDSQIKTNSNPDLISFKRHLYSQMQGEIDSIKMETQAAITKRINNIGLEYLQIRKEQENNNTNSNEEVDPLIPAIEEQFLPLASTQFQEQFARYKQIAQSGMKENPEIMNEYNNIKTFLLKEIDLLNQGYTKDQYYLDENGELIVNNPEIEKSETK